MEQELEGEQPLLEVGLRIFQLDQELVDLVDNARLRRAVRRQSARWQRRSPEARRFHIGIIDFQVDEMPVLRLLVVVAPVVAVSILVCPGRLAREVVRSEIVRVRIEHGRNLGLDRRLQILFCDKRYRPVSIVAPYVSPVASSDEQQNAQNVKCFHSPLATTPTLYSDSRTVHQ